MTPNPKYTFGNLKKEVQEIYRKLVSAHVDKAVNNDVTILKLYYVHTLKQEPSTSKPMSIICLVRGLSLMGIGVIRLLSLVCL